jgi:hypothetical protein
MPSPMNVSPGGVSRTSQVTDDHTPLRINERIRNALGLQVDPTPKKTRSFLARLSTFATRLFRGNRNLQLQRAVTPIPAKWTETECLWLKKFGGARIDIFLSFAKKYLEDFPDPELQRLMPAVIQNYNEDFNQKCYRLRAAATCQELPMSHMLYQAHWGTPIRNDGNSASVKRFVKFMGQRDTSKTFDSWLDGVTNISKPERPGVKSICNGLKDSDAIAVTAFLSESDEALLHITETDAGHFSEVSEADPSLSSGKAIHASLQEEYLDVFCAEFTKYRKLDRNKLPPVAIHIYLAHQAAIATVLKPLPGLLESPVFSHLEEHIKKSQVLPFDIKPSAQAWASSYP